MAKTFRAVLIDPVLQSVAVTEIDGSLASIAAAVGTDNLDHFRIADFENSWDYGWVDDTGLLRQQPIHAFLLAIRRDPLAGRCLLVGVDKGSKDNCDAKFDVQILRAEITWLGLIKPEVTSDKTEAGGRTIVTYERVK